MMFNETKYTVWYFSIISIACDKNRRKSVSEYYESHHIIPKSLGGSDTLENKVLLTAREHFICHLLLTKMCMDFKHEYKMKWALHRLTHGRKKYTSGQYEVVRKIHSKNMRLNHPNKSEDNKAKLSKSAHKNWKNNPNRKVSASLKMKETWKKNYNNMLQNARINGSMASKFGRDNPRSENLELEYMGNFYWSYKELLEKTGCSKHLYLKYYKKGIDPTARIGKNGPAPKDKK